MCGICCIFAPKNSFNLEEINKICRHFKGPLRNRGPDQQYEVNFSLNQWEVYLNSSVLWLQGEEITNQPVETQKSWFLFNGDVFGNEIISSNIRRKHGDTKPLLNALENSKSILETLSNVQGPYAFIYLDKINSKLYFARDTFGRRSLLIGKDNEKIILTSVASRKLHFPMLELPALGIFCVDLSIDRLEIQLLPWKVQNQHFSEKLKELNLFLSIQITVENYYSNENNLTVNIPKESELLLLKNIVTLKIDDAFKLIESDEKWAQSTNHLNELLEDAIFRRINNQPKFCKTCISEKINCNHSLIGVLFSGGLDCAILSLIADKFIDKNRPIDLMNVAFEKGNSYDTPDRISARQTLKELQNLCPDRQWNLLEINVTQDELNFERSDKISDLIYPLDSILDESLGCALWFAARGSTNKYISNCRVLLVGMGADELFGGYSRHRAAFKHENWAQLTTELDRDWKNISHRNLARDDRVISDHGRQVRTPYLDENFVEFVRNLEPWDRCYPNDKLQGFGDKLLLRCLAHKLGLTQAAVLKKRALQFGSRIANSKENAHAKSPRL